MSSSSLQWTPRFAERPRLLAMALVGFAVLAMWGILAGGSIDNSKADPDDEHTDLALYQSIIDRMDRGQGYYESAAIELPARDYPNESVLNVREPTLATYISTVGRPAAVATMLVLGAVALIGSIRTFELTERGRLQWISAVVLAAAGIGIFCRPSAVEQHEVLAALLVYLGLLVRGHGWIGPAVALILVAGLIRELAAPVMALMLLMALIERKREEAWKWAAALALFAAFYCVHIWQFNQMHGAQGPPGPGWLRFGGWPFAVDAMWGSSVLTLLPHAIAAIAVPLALLGWLSRSGPFFDRVSIVLVAYVLLFCLAGRPDNYYWGMLVSALLMPGIGFGVAFILQSGRRAISASRRPTIEA